MSEESNNPSPMPATGSASGSLELTGGDAFSDLMRKPEAMLNNALAASGKAFLRSMLNDLKLFLACATEPFFRKDMGERYFSKENLNRGVIGWVLCTLITFKFPADCSGGRLVFSALHFYWFAHLVGSSLIILTAGVALAYYFYKFGRESLATMEKYRAEGIPRHSLSRGVPRWGDRTGFILIGICVVLPLLNLPAGLLFMLSVVTSAKLAGEQHAAIYARYLDVLDKRIEDEYLENAILGECPVGITQLVYPLPNTLAPDLRKNIAAAAVGKPVQVFSQKPSRAASPPPAQPSEAQPPPLQPRAQTVTDTLPTAPVKAEKPNSKKLFLIGVIALLVVAASGYAKFVTWLAKPVNSPATVASLPANPQPVPQQVVQAPLQPVVAQPLAQNSIAEPQPVSQDQHVATPPPEPVKTLTPEQQASTLATLERKRNEEERNAPQPKPAPSPREINLNQFKSLLADQVAALDQLKTNLETQIDENTNRIAKASWLRRGTLTRQNEKARAFIDRSLQDQQKALGLVQDSVQVFSSDPGANPDQVADNFKVYADIARDIELQLDATLNSVSNLISGKATGSGFIQSR